jgi:AcrR family transcriptional regulator
VSRPATRDQRQSERRTIILESARQLLGDRGWHGVGIDEVGAASGLTGPAVYRYFESKQALLTEAMGHAAEQMWSSLPPDADSSLEAFVDSHVRFVLDNADLVELWYREARHLSPGDLRAQRRLQRRYIERGVDALLARWSALDGEEAQGQDREQARTMVRAAIGLMHSVAHSDERLDPGRLRPLLVDMALAALDCRLPAPRRTEVEPP